VFDVETGGLDETKNPITQYAAVVLDGKTLKEIDRWETFIRPYGDLTIEQRALDHTMVSMADINKGLSIEKFIDTAITFWEQYMVRGRTREQGRLIPVGHNVTFDLRFINYALAFCGKPNIEQWMYPNFIDTLVLSKLAFGVKGDEKINLGAVCALTKIKLTDAHGAMNDTLATTELLRYFMRQLRSISSSGKTTVEERPKGIEFFEFKCAKK
jgi:DNA polymerase III alpha subunit (gram-positive type)